MLYTPYPFWLHDDLDLPDFRELFHKHHHKHHKDNSHSNSGDLLTNHEHHHHHRQHHSFFHMRDIFSCSSHRDCNNNEMPQDHVRKKHSSR